MGYYADSIDRDFIIPADKVADALAAINASDSIGGTYETLDEAIRANTCFEGNEEVHGSFHLGWHTDKYLWGTDDVLGILAPFAKEGSYVRFSGEDDSLFGYRVQDGKLVEEFGEIIWH
jgi:hypothetical protein